MKQTKFQKREKETGIQRSIKRKKAVFMQHTSSTKMTLGAILLAKEKTALTYFSPSPNHCKKNITVKHNHRGNITQSSHGLKYIYTFEVMLDIEILIKFAPASVATAFASIVFPVPGGPNNSIPFVGCMKTIILQFLEKRVKQTFEYE